MVCDVDMQIIPEDNLDKNVCLFDKAGPLHTLFLLQIPAEICIICIFFPFKQETWMFSRKDECMVKSPNLGTRQKAELHVSRPCRGADSSILIPVCNFTGTFIRTRICLFAGT